MDVVTAMAEASEGSHILRDIPILFASTPSDAVQCKLAADAYGRKAHSMAIYPDPLTKRRTDDMLRMLRATDTFLWSESTSRDVLTASESLGSGALRGTVVVPAIHAAFCAFAAPVLSIEIHGTEQPLSALMWSMGRFVETNREILRIYGLVWIGAVAAVVVIGSWPPEGADEGDEDVVADMERFTKFILTASDFVEQRIAVVGDARAVQRQTEKQAVRAGYSPVVKTIELRARDYERKPNGTGSGRELSCRHLVRRHPRMQPYPSTGECKRIWIESYVKGPEDAPLRAPKPEVFAVCR